MLRYLETFFDQIQFRIAVKAAVAATLSLVLGVLFGHLFDRPDTLVSGLWTVLSSIVVVNAYLGGTYIAAVIRFLGTLVGAVVAGLCITTMGSSAPVVGLGVFLTVVICSLLRLKESVRIASITTALIMILSASQPTLSPWLFGFFRFVDSTMGIIIAVIVAHTLWPTQATRKVRVNMVNIMQKMRSCYLQSSGLQAQDEVSYPLLKNEITALLAETRDHIKASRIEIRTRSSLEDWNFLLDHLYDLFDAVVMLGEVDKTTLEGLFDPQLKGETEETLQRLDKAMMELITVLAMRKEGERSVNLKTTFAEVESRLQAFRERRKGPHFGLKAAEGFFVFYYSLRHIGDELLKLDERLHGLYGDSEV